MSSFFPDRVNDNKQSPPEEEETLLISSCHKSKTHSEKAYCANGGFCIELVEDGEEHKGCDCPSGFTGDHCETKVDHAVNQFNVVSCEYNVEHSKHAFCTHGGTCKGFVHADEPHVGCECPEPYIGDNCETKPKDEYFGHLFRPKDESVETCPTPGNYQLVCMNKGECRVGEKPVDLYDHLDEATGEWLHEHLHETNTNDDGGMYCECQEGWTGNYCEVKVVTCGENEHICLHGGICVENGLNDEDEKYECLCAQLGEGKTASGKYCEFVAAFSCSDYEKYQLKPYCENGGTCYEKKIQHAYWHTECECPPDFFGKQCEIEKPKTESTNTAFDAQDEKDVKNEKDVKDVKSTEKDLVFGDSCLNTSNALQCTNGGACLIGSGDSIAGHFAEFTNLPFSMVKDPFHEDMHCSCPRGFAGLLCEHEVSFCGNDEDVCFHGGVCLRTSSGYSCECEAHLNADEPAALGEKCEHVATTSCEAGNAFSKEAFCTNDGICKGIVTSGSDHLGCHCPEGFTGDYCEIVNYSKALGSNDNMFMKVGILAVVVFPIVLMMMRRSASKRRATAAQHVPLDLTLDADGGTMPYSDNPNSSYSDKPEVESDDEASDTSDTEIGESSPGII